MALATVQVQGADGARQPVLVDTITGQIYAIPVHKLGIGAVGADDGVISLNNPLPIRLGNSSSVDAFGRLRVSSPETQFDSKQLFDNLPLFWDDQETSGTGTTSSHDVDEAATTMGVGTAAGTRVRQTFLRFNYQPGKSQLVYTTGNLQLTGGGTGITSAMGYFDDENGLFVRNNEGTLEFVKRSKITGSVVDTAIGQSDWNLDRLDGTGPSGLTIDLTKAQNLVTDFEWLSVGPVRFGFVIGGNHVECHKLLAANVETGPYMSTPNLPLRYEISNDGTGAASTIMHICSTVISEGGLQPQGTLQYHSTGGTHIECNTANTVYALVGLKLQDDKLDCVMGIVSLSVMSETADDFEWLLIHNPTIASVGTADPMSYSNKTNSCLQVAVGEGSDPSESTVTGGTVMNGGFVRAEASFVLTAKSALRLGSTIAGVSDEVVLAVRPLTMNANVQGSLTWQELD